MYIIVNSPGLCMYFLSLITNNVILSCITICTFYVSYSIFGLCRRGSSQSMLYDLEDRVVDLHEKAVVMEKNFDRIEEKMDQLLASRE